MAKYEYNGEGELVLPTLGVTVKKGDVFDGPEGLTVAGVAPVSGKASSKVSAPEPVADETTITEEVK